MCTYALGDNVFYAYFKLHRIHHKVFIYAFIVDPYIISLIFEVKMPECGIKLVHF